MTKNTGFQLAHRPKIVRGKMQCITCYKSKRVTEFSKTSRNVLGRMHTCKACMADGTFIRLCGTDSYFKQIASVHRSSCKARGLAFDLDWQFLKDVYEYQQGLCFYTDAKMRILRGQGHSRLSLSIDRIVPAKGYIRGNIVLVTKRANLIKNDQTLDELKVWMPTWYQRLKDEGYENI